MLYDTIKMLHLEDHVSMIESVNIIHHQGILICKIKLKKQSEMCPRCNESNVIIHGYYEKKVTHSISTNGPCYLYYQARRYRCKYCNTVFYERNPFASKKMQTSIYTIESVLEALRSHTSTFTSVAHQFNLTKQQVIYLFDSYVDCSRKPLPSILCIDEFYTSKISSHKYACVFLDFIKKEVVEIYPSRHLAYLANRLTILPEKERNNVHAVIIDMWESYKTLSKRYFRHAIVAVDSFHVIKHLHDAMMKIRIRVMNQFNRNTSKLQANEMYYYMLKKFHYFFVKRYEDIYDGEIKIPKIHAKWKKEEIRKYLLSIHPDLMYAYQLKEKYREFNLTADYDTCDEELDQFIYEFTNSHLEEFRSFGYTLYNWKEEIKNSFIRIDKRRLSSGAMEGVNSRIKTILKNANGYQNFFRLRNKIIYSINKNEPTLNSPKKKI